MRVHPPSFAGQGMRPLPVYRKGETAIPVHFQLPARMGHTDEELAFIREMGIRYLNLNVMPPQANEEDLQREKERLARFDLEISDLACPPLQKNPAIILGRSRCV